PTDSTTFPFRSSDWVTRAGADARANVRVSPGAVVTAGAALERESMRGTTLDTSRARLGGAVYGQVVLTGRPLDATLGARLDDNERFGRFATYRAGAAWRLAGGARAVASLGTGSKEPSFYQKFGTGFVRGNPAPRAALGARYFDQRFRDLIDYNGADTVTNYFNVPGANARGVELTGDAAPAAGLQLALAYTLLRTRVTAGGADTSATALYRPGQSLLRRPRQAGRLTIAYRPPAGAARAGVAVAVAYTGARADVDYRTFQRVTLPGYTRVDVAADVTPRAPHDGLPGLTLRARIENVFDRAYEEIKNFPARRRTLLFGVRCDSGPDGSDGAGNGVMRWWWLALLLAGGCSDALEQTSSAGQVVAFAGVGAVSVVSAATLQVTTAPLPGSGALGVALASRGNLLLAALAEPGSAGRLARVPAAHPETADTLSLPGTPAGVAAQDDSIAWVALPGRGPAAVAVTAGRVFVVNPGAGTGPSWLNALDPAGAAAPDSIPLTGAGAIAATVGGDSLLYVLARGAPGATDGRLSIVDPVTRVELVVINGLGGGAMGAVFHPSGRLLVASVTDGILEVNTLTRTVTRGPAGGVKPAGHGVLSLALDNGGRVFAGDAAGCTGGGGTVRVLSPPPDYRELHAVDVGACPAAATTAMVP